eukprot:9816961-Lingulodinium_polyedra.AAC.1
MATTTRPWPPGMSPWPGMEPARRPSRPTRRGDRARTCSTCAFAGSSSSWAAAAHGPPSGTRAPGQSGRAMPWGTT